MEKRKGLESIADMAADELLSYMISSQYGFSHAREYFAAILEMARQKVMAADLRGPYAVSRD